MGTPDTMPEFIHNEEQLDEFMARPYPEVVDLMRRLDGDIAILGIAGKMGLTLGAAAAGALRRGARIGHIGQRIDFFWTTIVNESELLERFKIEVLPIDMATFVDAVKDRVSRGRAGYAKEAREWRARAEVTGFADDEPLMRILAALGTVAYGRAIHPP